MGFLTYEIRQEGKKPAAGTKEPWLAVFAPPFSPLPGTESLMALIRVEPAALYRCGL